MAPISYFGGLHSFQRCHLDCPAGNYFMSDSEIRMTLVWKCHSGCVRTVFGKNVVLQESSQIPSRLFVLVFSSSFLLHISSCTSVCFYWSLGYSHVLSFSDYSFWGFLSNQSVNPMKDCSQMPNKVSLEGERHRCISLMLKTSNMN